MTYFVKIDDPAAVRRRLLESSKDTIHILKGYYQLLDVREQKREVVEELRSQLSEIARLADKLETLLPAHSLKELESLVPRKKSAKSKSKTSTKKATPKRARGTKKPVKSAKPAKPAQKQPNELERLETALSGIEDRLSKL